MFYLFLKSVSDQYRHDMKISYAVRKCILPQIKQYLIIYFYSKITILFS